MKIFITLLFACLFIWHCSEEKVSGTSSGIDNPQIILAFFKDGKNTKFSGTVTCYPSDFNLFNTKHKMVSLEIDSSSAIYVTSSSLQKLKKTSGTDKSEKSLEWLVSEWSRKNHINGDTLFFNLWAEADNGEGAFLPGFSWNRATNDFQFQDTPLTDTFQVELQSKTNLKAKVFFQKTWKAYYFPGTPIGGKFSSDTLETFIYPGEYAVNLIDSSNNSHLTNPTINPNNKLHHLVPVPLSATSLDTMVIWEIQIDTISYDPNLTIQVNLLPYSLPGSGVIRLYTIPPDTVDIPKAKFFVRRKWSNADTTWRDELWIKDPEFLESL